MDPVLIDTVMTLGQIMRSDSLKKSLRKRMSFEEVEASGIVKRKNSWLIKLGFNGSPKVMEIMESLQKERLRSKINESIIHRPIAAYLEGKILKSDANTASIICNGSVKAKIQYFEELRA